MSPRRLFVKHCLLGLNALTQSLLCKLPYDQYLCQPKKTHCFSYRQFDSLKQQLVLEEIGSQWLDLANLRDIFTDLRATCSCPECSRSSLERRPSWSRRHHPRPRPHPRSCPRKHRHLPRPEKWKRSGVLNDQHMFNLSKVSSKIKGLHAKVTWADWGGFPSPCGPLVLLTTAWGFLVSWQFVGGRAGWTPIWWQSFQEGTVLVKTSPFCTFSLSLWLWLGVSLGFKLL